MDDGSTDTDGTWTRITIGMPTDMIGWLRAEAAAVRERGYARVSVSDVARALIRRSMPANTAARALKKSKKETDSD